MHFFKGGLLLNPLEIYSSAIWTKSINPSRAGPSIEEDDVVRIATGAELGPSLKTFTGSFTVTRRRDANQNGLKIKTDRVDLSPSESKFYL